MIGPIRFFASVIIIIIIGLMMEAASTSETSVNFYQTTRRYSP
jgi:type IV secretory pathway VirB2 component (pilin)